MLVCVVVPALLAGTVLLNASSAEVGSMPSFNPVVEIEEDVYSYEPPGNGAGPMWCHGSTCLVRVGQEVFASGQETLPGVKPLNNIRWTLWKRGAEGWRLVRADEQHRTREPSPLATLPEGRLFLSVNPATTLMQVLKLQMWGESEQWFSEPQVLQFRADDPAGQFETLRPSWPGAPAFFDHSYRSFAADAGRQELLLIHAVGMEEAYWSFRDAQGNWSACDRLYWPWGATYEQPQWIKVCYPTVALKNRAAYFCGVSDIVEPNSAWRAFKYELTGQEWDFDFRRLFFTWNPDVTRGNFKPWLEVSSRDATCGWIWPNDLWVDDSGAAHILWRERAIDERLRERFFPEAKQSHALNYAVIRDGAVTLRATLMEAVEGGLQLIPGNGRFQVTPDGRLLVFFYVDGADAEGRAVSENRVMEVFADGSHSAPARVPLQHPLSSFFTATWRAGSALSGTIDLLGESPTRPLTLRYARVRLE